MLGRAVAVRVLIRRRLLRVLGRVLRLRRLLRRCRGIPVRLSRLGRCVARRGWRRCWAIGHRKSPRVNFPKAELRSIAAPARRRQA